MKKKLFYTLVFLSVPFILSAASVDKAVPAKDSVSKTASVAKSAAANKAVKGNAVKTANFRPGERNPFLSDEEKKKIEQEKEADNEQPKETKKESKWVGVLEQEELEKQKSFVNLNAEDDNNNE